MNALFIWNAYSLEYIQNHVSRTKQFERSRFITSQEEYNDYISELESKQGKARKNKKDIKSSSTTYSRVFICSELSWGEVPIFEGYKVGYEIIEKIRSHNFCITFFSFQGRKKIYENISERYKFLVKALPFEDLLKIRDDYKFSTDVITTSKLKFFRTYAFLNFGIIDDFAHRLKGINSGQENFNQTLQNFFTEVKSYKDFIGSKISGYLDSLTEYNDEHRIQLIQLLEARVSELTGVVKSKPKEFTSYYRILVIEDNKDNLETVKTSLRRYYSSDIDFNNCTLFRSSGVEALNIIKDYGNDFDFIIIDLELLDSDGFYQQVQGVDIYEYVRNNLRSTVVGIITGYGRKGIEKLLNIDQKFISSKQHLSSFGDEEIDRLMKNLLFEYAKKEKVNFNETGPILGIIGKTPGYKNELSRLINLESVKYHSDMWNEAKGLAYLYIKGQLEKDTKGWFYELLSNKTGVKDIIDFIEKKHVSLLAHRLIVLHFYLTHNQVYQEDKFQESVSSFMPFNNFGTDYLTTRLGFSREHHYNKSSDDINKSTGLVINGIYKDEYYKSLHKIKLINLFPEEREWIKDYQKDKNEILLKDNTRHSIPWLKEKYGSFFMLENFEEYSFDDLLIFFQDKLLNKYNACNTAEKDELALIIADGIPPIVGKELSANEVSIIEDHITKLSDTIDPE